MMAVFGEKNFMICCLNKKLDEKQNRTLFLDHPVFGDLNWTIARV